MLKKKFLLLVCCGSLCCLYAFEFEEIVVWENGKTYKDISERPEAWGVTIFLYTLINNQALCFDQTLPDTPRKYYIKNYITGEKTYEFENDVALWGAAPGGRNAIRDQYGKYVFLEKNGNVVLFDVETKKEYVPGEPLKRPENIYYIIRTYKGKPSDKYEIVKHNLITNEIVEISTVNKVYNIALNYVYEAYRTVEDLGDNQLLLHNNYLGRILQLDSTMTDIISVETYSLTDKTVNFMIYIRENNFIGFEGRQIAPLESTAIYSVLLINKEGLVEKEYNDLNLIQAGPFVDISGLDMNLLCLLSPNKGTVLFFGYSPLSSMVYVYRIIYDGVINDTRVRL